VLLLLLLLLMPAAYSLSCTSQTAEYTKMSAEHPTHAAKP
jgi:hypothetical protein